MSSSTNEIQYYETDFSAALDELERQLKLCSKLKSGKQKTDQLHHVECSLKNVNDIKRGYSLALKQLSDRSDTTIYKHKLEQHTKRLAQCLEDLKWVKTADTETTVRSDHTNETTLDVAVQIQGKTQTSLGNTQRLIHESKEIAMATSSRLVEQTHQIGQIQDQVIEIDDTLVRADKLLRTFTRRMATDRVILVFAFFVFVAIAAIVIYATLEPDQEHFQVPSDIKPPKPSDFDLANISLIDP